MVGITSYEIENDREFKAALKAASEKVSDLRFAFKEIQRDWFKSNTTIFKLKGSGLYPPLSPAYKAQKAKTHPNAPIMVRSGRLRDSVSSSSGRGNQDSIIQIGKSFLILGTKVPYGIYHQSDAPRSKMPLRKFLFIGPEAPRTAPSRITGRQERFLKIIELEVQRQLDKLNP